MLKIRKTYFNQYVSAAPLAVFRICFGMLMLISLIRFGLLGWIETLYITPKFHFSYYGFEWVKPKGQWTYLIFLICALSSIFITIGWRYKYFMPLFFLSFTYIELMDKTTYLNHYYFISSLSFLMIFLPANYYYSIDNIRLQHIAKVPRWSIDSLKLLIGIVYFYAGLAKLNTDWLLNAMPLRIWLPGKYDIPVIGHFLEAEWVAYFFSWGGAAYDLFIPFALLYKPTRLIAFIFVIVFHLMTRILFPIGMFPYIMIISTLIFFEADIHQKFLNKLSRIIKFRKISSTIDKIYIHKKIEKWKTYTLVIFFSWHLLVPFRYLFYPDNLFWTEEGYRFSWRVMLMEKAGNATFKIVDGKTKKQFYVNNRDFLSSFQEKQMSTQPDFILEYAHYLRDHFARQGHKNIEVYVDSYVALNGSRSRPFIDPNTDLTKEDDTFAHKPWILPFEK